MGGKQWNELQNDLSIFCSTRNFRDRSKGQKCIKKVGLGDLYENIEVLSYQWLIITIPFCVEIVFVCVWPNSLV